MTNKDELYWAMAVREALDIDDKKLVVYAFNGWDFLIESYELAAFLGYTQHSSLRKQTLTDWKHKFVSGVHYVMSHDEQTIRDYEELYRRVHGHELKPTKPSRGRLFFLPQGLGQLLKKSTKPTAHVVAALENRDIDLKMDEPLNFEEEIVALLPSPPSPKPARVVHDVPPRSREDRLFEYEVMQKLLDQLERLKEPSLRALAITAAETALGRELKEVREAEPSKREKAPAVPPPMLTPSGPLFLEDDYYSMTRIGEKAGGYSAKQAGAAVNLVGRRHGYTPYDLRNCGLPVNQVLMRPDSSTGKERRMVRFSKDFANEVVLELRNNPEFEAAFTQGIPTITPFAEKKSYPKLSQGPFDS